MSHDRLLPNVAAGVAGGIIGSAAMIAVNHLLAASGFAAGDLGRHDAGRRVHAKPNDTDGTISDEPASIKATAGAVEALTGTRPPERQRRVLGLVAHHAFGACVGGVYGALRARTARVTAGGGAAYGTLVWLTAAETGVPLAGLARDPREYPAVRHAASLISHLAFGLTLEQACRAIADR